MLKILRQSDLRKVVVAALFMPLVLFAFFSVSTMPVFSKSGIEIVICTGDSFKTITVDQQGKPVGEDRRTPCDWSLQAHAAGQPASPLIPTPTSYSYRIPGLGETLLLSLDIRNTHNARAPPPLT